MTIKEALEDILLFMPKRQKEKQTEQIDILKSTIEQLEDIEKELGIDLTIYHKLMSKLYCGDGDKLFVKDRNGKIIEVGILEIDYCKKKLILYKDNNYDADFTYGFSQYGKSFALTKDELVKGI